MDGVVTREGVLGLGHDKGRAAHAFDAAGHDQTGLARLDGAGGHGDGVHARPAETIDRGPRRGLAKPAQQGGHPRDIAIVFAGLVGAAQNDVVEG